ncbi:MAG: methylmalonyl-CoA mutase family protein [Rikenellaceae bacterium]
MSNKLFSEFPPVSTEQWEEAIHKDLKGADYEKKLVWRTQEGFSVRPYYRAEDLTKVNHLESKPGEFPYVRGTKANNNWLVRQTIVVNCAKEANATALNALMRGADSLNFKITSKEFTAEDLDTLLSGIELQAIEVNFEGCGIGSVARLFMTKVAASTIAKDDVKASFNIDPLVKQLSLKGKICGGAFEKLKSLISEFKEFKSVRFITVNGDTFVNSGSTIVQELALSLAVAHDYIVTLMEAGFTIDEAAKAIKFNFAISSNYFMEIAKFRAARLLWANIVEAYNPTKGCAAKMKAHATTSMFNMSVYDPYVNMLRATTEGMSAAISGVSSIEVLPFDAAYNAPTEFSSRIARNTQLLLKEESHFNQVADAAGGSYYIEKLTQDIADNAWALFKEVEDKGGYTTCFKEGVIQGIIAQSAANRRKAIATRREILLGTNQYPNFTETVTNVATKKECKSAHSCGCSSEKTETVEVLVPFRAGEEFEELRLAVDASGKAPKAFMFTIGSLAFARARSQFASNFFGCAGIGNIDNNLFSSVEEGVAAAKASGAEIVVICSSDDEYATYAPQIAEALSDKIIVVAGAPACAEELKAQGITNFINVRSNVLETLCEYKKQLL